MSQDFYSVLGIKRDSTQEDVKRAYRDLAKKYHPDRHHGATDFEKTEASAKFREISEAYEILGEADARTIYDKYGRSAARRGSAPGSSSSYATHHHTYSYNHRYKTNAEEQYERSAQSFLRMLRRGMTPANILFHGGLLSVLVAGAYVGRTSAQGYWDYTNQGRSFQDLEEGIQERTSRAQEERRAAYLAKRNAADDGGSTSNGDPSHGDRQQQQQQPPAAALSSPSPPPVSGQPDEQVMQPGTTPSSPSSGPTAVRISRTRIVEGVRVAAK